MANLIDPDGKSTPCGNRDNSSKPKLSMVFDASNALDGAARVLEYGEDKYDRGNWLKGLPWTEILDSLLRHAKSFNAGVDLDEESGLPHVDHMLVNALFLAEMVATHHPDLDDRTSSRVYVEPADDDLVFDFSAIRPVGDPIVPPFPPCEDADLVPLSLYDIGQALKKRERGNEL